MSASLPAGDQKLVQIVDAALTDTARRSGDWLVCKLGCTQCCVGVFAINALDVARLQNGMADLQRRDPSRATRVRARAHASVTRLTPDYPGDPQTGILYETEEAVARFEEFANDEVCPALDPETGACDLYAARPMTCRVFGPPVRSEDGLGVCELCYHGASEEEISACEMVLDTESVEQPLLEDLAKAGQTGQTVVAFALDRDR